MNEKKRSGSIRSPLASRLNTVRQKKNARNLEHISGLLNQNIFMDVSFPTLDKKGIFMTNVYCQVQDSLPDLVAHFDISIKDIQGLDFFLSAEGCEGHWVHYGTNYMSVIDKINNEADHEPEKYFLEVKKITKPMKTLRIRGGEEFEDVFAFEYDADQTVKDALDTVLEYAGLSGKPYSMYSKYLNLWFSETELLWSYNLDNNFIVKLLAYTGTIPVTVLIKDLNIRMKYRIPSDGTIADSIKLFVSRLETRSVAKYTLWYQNPKTSLMELLKPEKFVFFYQFSDQVLLTLETTHYVECEVEIFSEDRIEKFSLHPSGIVNDICNYLNCKIKNCGMGSYDLYNTAGNIYDKNTSIKEIDFKNDVISYRRKKANVLIRFAISSGTYEEITSVDFFDNVKVLHSFACRAFGLNDQEAYAITYKKKILDVNLKLITQIGNWKSDMEFDVVKLREETAEINPVWSAKEEVVYEDDDKVTVSAASYYTLIAHLTSLSAAKRYFINTFLLTYQSFATAENLLESLIARYYVCWDQKTEFSEFQTLRMSIRIHVCNVLKSWIETSLDFNEEDSPLTRKLHSFIVKDISFDNEFLYAQLRKSLVKVQRKEKPKVTDLIQEDLPKEELSIIFEKSPAIFAQQLCLIACETYRKIKSHELMNQAWAKPKLQHRAPNVLSIIALCNTVGDLVKTCILEENVLKRRTKRYIYFLELAEHLFNMNNFGILMAVLGGLNDSAVSRLKLTKKSVPSQYIKRLAELEDLMNPQGNYRNYRQIVPGLVPPLIPCMPVYISDLIFLDEGNPDKLNNLINFGKCQLTNRVITEIRKYQLHGYDSFQPVSNMQNIILTFKNPKNEEEWYSRSLELEPRVTTPIPS